MRSRGGAATGLPRCGPRVQAPPAVLSAVAVAVADSVVADSVVADAVVANAVVVVTGTVTEEYAP